MAVWGNVFRLDLASKFCAAQPPQCRRTWRFLLSDPLSSFLPSWARVEQDPGLRQLASFYSTALVDVGTLENKDKEPAWPQRIASGCSKRSLHVSCSQGLSPSKAGWLEGEGDLPSFREHPLQKCLPLFPDTATASTSTGFLCV